MTPQEIKAKVLEQYPDAMCYTYMDFYQIQCVLKLAIIGNTELQAWQDFYEKYCTKQPTNMKQLTRQDFENLPVGSEINNEFETFKFNHIVNDIVFLINSIDAVQAFSLNLLNTLNYTIQKPKQYNKGWEVRSYEGDNVWVKLSDKSGLDATHTQYAYLLKRVAKDIFTTDCGVLAKFAVQLTDINTTTMCDESKIHDK